MSTVFIIKNDSTEIPNGFTKSTEGVFYCFETTQYGKTESLTVTSEGEPVFPEDFPNKRAFLQKVKSKGKGWTKFSGYFRLKNETISLIKSIGVNTFFCVNDISVIEQPIDEFIEIPLSNLSSRLLLKYEEYYFVS